MTVLTINLVLFAASFLGSSTFIDKFLFSEQDVSRARVPKLIFQFTLSACVMIFAFFIEECQQSFDPSTSQTLWKSGFFALDLLLLLFIPLAFIKDLCTSDNKRKKAKTSRLFTLIICSLFTTILLIDAFIFNHYLMAPTISQVTTQLGLSNTDEAASQTKTFHERVDDLLSCVSGLLSFYLSTEEQLEFLTLTGIIFNALMSGYVCANSIYVYLIENIETAPLDISSSAFTTGFNTEKVDSKDLRERLFGAPKRTLMQVFCCRKDAKA